MNGTFQVTLEHLNVSVWLSFSWFITVQLQTVSCFFHLVFIFFVVHFQLPNHGVDSFLSSSLVFVCFQFYKLTGNNQHVLGANPSWSGDLKSFELTDVSWGSSVFIHHWVIPSFLSAVFHLTGCFVHNSSWWQTEAELLGHIKYDSVMSYVAISTSGCLADIGQSDESEPRTS